MSGAVWKIRQGNGKEKLRRYTTYGPEVLRQIDVADVIPDPDGRS